HPPFVGFSGGWVWFKPHVVGGGAPPAPPATLHRALAFWTRLHGVLSLELAGHFTGMGFDPERFYEAELADLLRMPTES
ncbi:TetR-like C-terminal domain-containing protein, partial [Streptomyces sp. NPDC127044]